MTILTEILQHEVVPAMGCTEPVSVALACAYASKAIGGKVWRIVVETDPGTFKNGMNVFIPGAKGATGIPVAAALGALCCNPKDGLHLLKNVKDRDLKEAKKLIATKQVILKSNFEKKGLYIKVKIKTNTGEGIATIACGHTNLIELKKNGVNLIKTHLKGGNGIDKYRDKLRCLTIRDLINEADKATKKDLKYIEEGIEMNLKASAEGAKYNLYSAELKKLIETGINKKGLFPDTKIAIAAAADGRMSGMPFPVMSSGGSGNQGLVAILVPYFWGKYFKAAGCVYQEKHDLKLITYAIDNVANDLGGMFCNGANLGCAVKVASSAHSALSAAFSALDGYHASGPNGIIGFSAEETLQNLAQITVEGMAGTNQVILGIMKRQVKVS
ncbi:MAG: hypothetical protein UW03_C0002G0046 [Candidatus Peregrinibacteria bacterium GW2011_GWA2_43_8]|nr:MAG: hypothetical protein UW03_C0002G0046 [Candidatus Peregrinibacteria bacterium GW2011_GWA2_43_8]